MDEKLPRRFMETAMKSRSILTGALLLAAMLIISSDALRGDDAAPDQSSPTLTGDQVAKAKEFVDLLRAAQLQKNGRNEYLNQPKCPNDLWKIMPGAIPFVEGLLTEKSLVTRCYAVDFLVPMGSEKAVDALEQIMTEVEQIPHSEYTGYQSDIIYLCAKLLDYVEPARRKKIIAKHLNPSFMFYHTESKTEWNEGDFDLLAAAAKSGWVDVDYFAEVKSDKAVPLLKECLNNEQSREAAMEALVKRGAEKEVPWDVAVKILKGRGKTDMAAEIMLRADPARAPEVFKEVLESQQNFGKGVPSATGLMIIHVLKTYGKDAEPSLEVILRQGYFGLDGALITALDTFAPAERKAILADLAKRQDRLGECARFLIFSENYGDVLRALTSHPRWENPEGDKKIIGALLTADPEKKYANIISVMNTLDDPQEQLALMSVLAETRDNKYLKDCEKVLDKFDERLTTRWQVALEAAKIEAGKPKDTSPHQLFGFSRDANAWDRYDNRWKENLCWIRCPVTGEEKGLKQILDTQKHVALIYLYMLGGNHSKEIFSFFLTNGYFPFPPVDPLTAPTGTIADVRHLSDMLKSNPDASVVAKLREKVKTSVPDKIPFTDNTNLWRTYTAYRYDTQVELRLLLAIDDQDMRDFLHKTVEANSKDLGGPTLSLASCLKGKEPRFVAELMVRYLEEKNAPWLCCPDRLALACTVLSELAHEESPALKELLVWSKRKEIAKHYRQWFEQHKTELN
jgi:hypothetical protein